MQFKVIILKTERISQTEKLRADWQSWRYTFSKSKLGRTVANTSAVECDPWNVERENVSSPLQFVTFKIL